MSTAQLEPADADAKAAADGAVQPLACIVIAPNASLSWRQALWFMLGISTISLGIGMAFAVLGFWVILPFAGLELAALAAALYVSLRGNAAREVVTVTRDRVCIETGRVDQPERRQRHEFHRAWARLEVEPGRTTGGAGRLRLGASGQFIELGACLSEQQRLGLAQRLTKLLAS